MSRLDIIMAIFVLTMTTTQLITSLVAINFSETVKVSNCNGTESWNLAQVQVNITYMENDSGNILKFVMFSFSSYATLKYLIIA